MMRRALALALVVLVSAASSALGDEMKKARVLVFEGLADWEIGLVTYELNTRNDVPVQTVGLSDTSIVTGGGLRVVPDVVIDSVDASESAVLILPGGEMWHGALDPRLEGLVRAHIDQGVSVAAICAATSYLARLGLLDADVRHTSNALVYLKDVVPEYAGEDLYVESPAVSDAGIITAGGEASREFAYEILKALGVYDDEVLAEFAEFWGCRLGAPSN